MLRSILFFILILVVYYILRLFIKGIPFLKKNGNGETESEEFIQDPYCQTYISKQSAVKKKIRGRMLYFCTPECQENYLKISKKNVDK